MQKGSIYMKKSIKAKVAATLTSACLAVAMIPGVAAADSTSTVTLGADLTQEQQQQVLSFFGLADQDQSTLNIITVTNADEHKYCDATIPTSVTGTRTLSCSYIQPTTSGGINVQTANLTSVTKETLYNALQTAGVENCNLVVTAPFEVSGTGALTGVFMAYQQSGNTLDSSKTDAAVEEMYTTAGLQETYGDDVADVISDVKNEVISATSDMTDDQIKELIKQKAQEYGVSISDSDIATIVGLIDKIKALDYDVDAFNDTLKSATDTLNNLKSQSEGFMGWLQGLMDGISGFFSGIFGGSSSSSSASGSIIDSLNTNVFQLDK